MFSLGSYLPLNLTVVSRHGLQARGLSCEKTVRMAVRVSSLAEGSFLRLFANPSLGTVLISFPGDITLV